MSQTGASGRCSGELAFGPSLYTPAENGGIKGFPKMPMLSSGGRLHRQQLEGSPAAQLQLQLSSQGPALRPDVPKKVCGESYPLGHYFFPGCTEGSSCAPCVEEFRAPFHR